LTVNSNTEAQLLHFTVGTEKQHAIFKTKYHLQPSKWQYACPCQSVKLATYKTCKKNVF